MVKGTLLCALVLINALWSTGTAFAASESDRILALESQLAAQREVMAAQQQMLEAMQREIDALKTGRTPTELPTLVDAPTGTTEIAPSAPAREPSQAAAESKPELELYGHFQLDAIYDFKRVDPTWESTLRPSTIPTVSNAFGDDGQTVISVKQTQMGMRGAFTTPAGLVKTWFEFDFFGTGADAGDTKFNLRHAWVEVGGLSFGQTNSNFMDVSIFPNVLDWWGPSGMVFNRNPQLRYTWLNSSSELALALEKPNGSFNTGVFGELSPEFGAAASAKTPLPDLTAHWRQEFGWGHYQIAGVLRKLEFETRGTPGNEPSFEKTGWGLNLTSVINTIGRDQLKLGVVYGEGISSFMNDGGVNLAPENSRAEPVPVLGVTAYYDRYWSDRWSSSIGVSVNDVDPRNQQAVDEFDRGIYASGNLLYAPYPDALFGLELLWGEHRDVGDRTGEDFRAQFTLKHKFSQGL